uniref:C-type lectin domain family 4 member F n=1 Tax=Sus scrofa TaxID=9823 RepID=A0A8D1PQR2_PIG
MELKCDTLLVHGIFPLPLAQTTTLGSLWQGARGREQHWRMKEAEMSVDVVRFCTDKQSVSLRSQDPGFSPAGLDPSAAVAPAAAPNMPRRLQATVAFVVVTVIFSLMVLFIVDPYHAVRGAELQEAIQMFKRQQNSSTYHVEIEKLSCRVDNVSSELQLLGGHLENASADIQVVKGVLKDASTLSVQTQVLRSSLEGTTFEIQRLKGDLEEAQALNSQAQSFLKSSLENTSTELHVVSGGLENAHMEIQVLKAGLEMANAQAQMANSSLKNVDAQIHVLRGSLDGIDDLRTQYQVLRSSLEGATAEMQRLKGSLQNANALSAQTQTFLKGSLDNTSAEIQVLRGHLEKASSEIHLLKRDLETVTAQTQIANSHLEQTDAQMHVFKTDLESTTALKAKIQMLNDLLRNASQEIQTLKRGLKDATALNSKARVLERNLQEARAEIQKLKGDLENTKTLATRIQEEQRRLEALHVPSASQEQLQRTQNQLLQLILQGWKPYNGNLYYFSQVKKSWQEAEQFCVSQGAHLASVTSEEEQGFVKQFTSSSYYWIGLTDSGSEGIWRWTDGTPFNNAQSRRFWSENQPDNWKHQNGQREDCVQIQQKWNDMYCTALFQWVCKKPLDRM